MSAPSSPLVALLARVGLFLTLCVLSGCRETGERTEAGPPEARVQQVRTAPVETGRAIEYYRTTAEIRAQERIEVASEVAGKVVAIAVMDGARVEQGDVLVRLKADAERAALASAKAAVYERRQELERAETLAARDYATRARVETARARAEAAEAQLQQAEKELEDRTIRAPFAGKVGLIDVSPGDYVDPGEELFDLVMVDALRVRFSVPQTLRRALQPGKQVLVAPEDGEDVRTTAVIRSVSPSAEEASRSFSAEAELAAEAGLEPGTFVIVRLPVETRPQALFVPETAVQRSAASAYVFRVTGDDRVERVEVRTGVLRRGMVEVSGRLSASDEVVVSGLQKISDGDRIRRISAGRGSLTSRRTYAGTRP